jgi:hypothetical protein
MSDEELPEVTEIHPEPGVIKIDGNRIASIILTACRTTDYRSRVAANRILEYVAELLNDTHKVN